VMNSYSVGKNRIWFAFKSSSEEPSDLLLKLNSFEDRNHIPKTIIKEFNYFLAGWYYVDVHFHTSGIWVGNVYQIVDGKEKEIEPIKCEVK